MLHSWNGMFNCPLLFRGCFHVLDAGANLNLGEFKAQFPSKVSSKVYDIVKMIPNNLQLQLLPRMDDWPKSFEIVNPVYEDIGLFFFPNEPDGYISVCFRTKILSHRYVLKHNFFQFTLLLLGMKNTLIYWKPPAIMF